MDDHALGEVVELFLREVGEERDDASRGLRRAVLDRLELQLGNGLVGMEPLYLSLGVLARGIEPERQLVLRQGLDHETLFRIQVGGVNVLLHGLGLLVQLLARIADPHPDDRVLINGKELLHFRYCRFPVGFPRYFWTFS